MREIANQLFIGLSLLANALFAVLAGLLLKWPHLDHHMPSLLRQRDCRVNGQWLQPQTQQIGLKAQRGEIIGARAAQGLVQQGGLGHTGGKFTAHHDSARLAQRILKRRIDKTHHAALIKDGNQGAKPV